MCTALTLIFSIEMISHKALGLRAPAGSDRDYM
jgi:hypothetical protein